MATATTERDIKVILTLDSEEAIYLRDLLQNGREGITEMPNEYDKRSAIFIAIVEALRMEEIS
jgi:hypothetical protein